VFCGAFFVNYKGYNSHFEEWDDGTCGNSNS